ncbi:restriction endonuclease-like protein [Clostridium beijerinckii]|nr:restriction endonuclease-like protein [Clostridium beijerinckii]UYZ37996.1 restriction endonuclease-like protein [Clostridium beijerinckii]
MDSQPSGNNNELLFIETENIIFVLKGERYGISDEAILRIKSFNKEPIESDIEYVKGLFLKEYSNYEIIIQSKNNANIEFYHENINIRNEVTSITSKSKNLSGVINFKGDIGATDFVIKVNNKIELEITLEVYPTKISYKEDYKAILRDVNEEIYNLAYGFLARTYLSSEINNKSNNNDSEFYSILNYVFDKLKKSVDIILYNPYHELQKDSRVVKYHKIRNASNETIKYLEKRPYLMEKINGTYLPKEALITNKTVTTNTKENRFLKFMLLKIIDKIDKFLLKLKKLNNNDKEILEKLNSFKREINKRINTSILRNIPCEYNEANLSLVFSMGNGYKEVYKYYLMLQKGLSINSNIFSLSMKELSLLYEYWCFIKINSLLKKKYKLVSSDILKIKMGLQFHL